MKKQYRKTILKDLNIVFKKLNTESVKNFEYYFPHNNIRNIIFLRNKGYKNGDFLKKIKINFIFKNFVHKMRRSISRFKNRISIFPQKVLKKNTSDVK